MVLRKAKHLILTSQNPADPRQMGGKAAALAELSRELLPIPPWFAISPQAFELSLNDSQRAQLAAADDSMLLQKLTAQIQPAAEVVAAIERSVRELSSGGQLLAVRSSAVDEDGAGHSFAGQLESFLFVSPQQVAGRVADVWHSGFTDRVMA